MIIGRVGFSVDVCRFVYDRFIEELQKYGVRPFDADHVLIPPMSKAQLEELAAKLR